jgi:AraC-like DNA-binding protein
MIGTAIATAARILWRMLERRGIDPAPLFDEAGLDASSRDNPLTRYPAKESTQAWVQAGEMLDDPAFGLSIAEVWQPSDFHALTRLLRYNPVVYDLVSYSLVECDTGAILSYNPVHGQLDEPAILEDTRWAVVLDACRRICGPDLDPLEVTFWHAEPMSEMDVFQDYFRCPLRFGEAVASMTLPAEVLDKPLPAANRVLALALDRTLSACLDKLRRDDIVSRTKSAITEHLPSGNPTSAGVAADLHLTSRTLQRKLVAEGTTYRTLVDAVRQELAESYLADGDFSLTEISYLLGFSSPAAFTRAFKRWTGLPPQQFRGAN